MTTLSELSSKARSIVPTATSSVQYRRPPPDPQVYNPRMKKPKKGRKVALVAGLALVVLSVGMVWTYWEEIRSWYSPVRRPAAPYP